MILARKKKKNPIKEKNLIKENGSQKKPSQIK
jgi:hypothetical protein